MTEVYSKRILLGVTGGIAAYKSAELARWLVKAGHQVQAVLTESALHFIGPATLQALSGKPALTALWNLKQGDGMDHIYLSRDADAIVIAPASADFIAKLAQGHADDLLSTLCLARTCPLAIAPAMNQAMWANPATQRNINQLVQDGVLVWGPDAGEQACGEIGLGRMREPEHVAQDIDALFQPKLLTGKRVLITAGPTYEPIDPVRGITNLSSGKMGYAVAQAAWEAGAEVHLISGPTALRPPPVAQFALVTTALDMHEAVMEAVAKTDVFISVAAVADYRVDHIAQQKIKKRTKNISLELVPNPDILGEVAALKNPPFCVGFAAETENIETWAKQKRAQKQVPLIVGNHAPSTLGCDETSLILIDSTSTFTLKHAPKTILARQLIRIISSKL